MNETSVPSMFTELHHSGGRLVVRSGVGREEMKVLVDCELPPRTLVIVEQAPCEPSPYEDDEEGEDHD